MTGSRFSVATLAYLAMVLLLGGASAAGFAGNALLQILGAGLIGWAMWRRSFVPLVPGFPVKLMGVCLALLLVMQLLPLPPALWSMLPGRESVAAGYEMLGRPLPWMTMSLDGWASLASLAWWIPALALFLAVRDSQGPDARKIVLTIVAVAVLANAFGAMQRAGGLFYFYRITNFGLSTGFFSNANHQASFLLASIAMFVASAASTSPFRVRADRRQTMMVLQLGIVILLVIGVLLSNSLAGMGLLFPVMAGAFLITRPDLVISRRLVFAAIGLCAAGLVAFAYVGSIELAGVSPVEQAGQTRQAFLVTGIDIVRDMAPFGSGLGTFEAIYHWYEAPQTIGTMYVNHAHNDLLELLIETGLVGLVMVAAFMVWWMRRSWTLWSRQRGNVYALAASVATGAILAHSLVDYPLRTAAMSSIFAICLAFMLVPPRDTARASGGPGRSGQSVKASVSI